MTDRSALHAFLSHDAHEGWHGNAARLGVTVSGLLEVMGADLASMTERDPVVQAARKVDAARRRRRRS